MDGTPLPAPALRDLARRLGVVMQTMVTDDMSDPQTPLRVRLVERITTLADVIAALRAAADEAGTVRMPLFPAAFSGPSLPDEESQPAHAATAPEPRRRPGREPQVWPPARDALMRERFPTSEDDEALLAALNAIPAPLPVPSVRQIQRRAWHLSLKRTEHVSLALRAKGGRAAAIARQQRGDIRPSKWTPERLARLRADLPDCTDLAALLASLNAMHGEPIASVDSMRQKAKELRLRRNADAARIARGAGRRRRAITEAEPEAPQQAAEQPPEPAPLAAPEAERLAESVDEAMQAMGLSPAAPTPSETHGSTAKAWAGSPRKGAVLPASQDDEKAEAFDAFDAGQTVRDVAADLGIPLSTLSNWHAEWKLRARKDAAA